MKKLYFFILLVVVAILFGAHDLIAQPPPSLPSDPSQSPIDGGLGFLAAGAGAYAFKKLRTRSK